MTSMDASRGGAARRLVVAVAFLAGAVAIGAAVSRPAARADQGPARAETLTPGGVAKELRAGTERDRVRVQLLLHAQPVLRETQRPAFRGGFAASPSGEALAAARRSPGRITAAERRSARVAELTQEDLVDELRDEAIETLHAQERVARAVRSRRGEVLGGAPLLNTVEARVRPMDLAGLAARRDVQAVLAVPRARPVLDVAAATVGASSWWAAGHTGGEGLSDSVSSDAAVLRESPDPTHPAFAGVTIQNSPAPSITTHGTHTAGTLISNDATYSGFAPGVDRLIGASGTGTWNNDVAYALGVTSEGGPGAADPAESLSESFATGMLTDNTNNDRDVVTDAFGVGIAAGAGNAGGPETVSNGYNNGLIVGAFDDHGTVSTADDTLACWNPGCSQASSEGPTPGGRKKPDILAPGTGITSPDGDWEGGAPDFTAVDGTSISTPMVAGSLALLEGAAIDDPRVQRAILTNSARFWPGQTHWEPDVGWGSLDLTKALAERAFAVQGDVEGLGARFYSATVATGAKATLAWNLRGFIGNFPGAVGASFTRTNLDLRQYRGSDLSQVTPPADPGHGGGPDAVDPNDTTEQVQAPSGGPQEIIYKVDAASTVDGADSESFGLAATAPLTPLTSPEVKPVNVAEDVAGTVNCQPGTGEVTITARARNDSDDLGADDADLTLQFPAGVELVSGPATQAVSDGTLDTGETSEEHVWTVRATSSGSKQLTVRGSGGTMDETFTADEQLSFTADCSPPAVRPTATVASPAGAVQCGTPVTITTRFLNDSHTDAGDVRATLALAGAQLVSGAATQSVSGGTLEKQTTSEPRTWTVRQSSPATGRATITGVGSVGAEQWSYPRTITLECTRFEAQITDAEYRFRKSAGALSVVGLVEPSGQGATPQGEIRIEVQRVATRGKRGRKSGKAKSRSATVELDGRGGFESRLRVCRPGRWKASATYLGSGAYDAVGVKLGVAKVKRRQLDC